MKEHCSSGLLSSEENNLVAGLVGARCQALSTTVVQVFHSEGPGHSYRWNKRSCGVVCFVKDNIKRSYYIRVYDLDHNLLVFEQEIYNQFKYKTPRPYFHTFEGDDAQIGLNFADEKEGEGFQQMVESKVEERKLRRERRQSSKKQLVQSNGGRPDNGVEKFATAYTSAAPPYKKDVAGKRVEKKKLKKEDIGMPTNFQHISHVGWDPNHGFDLENVDPNLKKFFQKAGVDEKALQDKDTRDFIYDFIDKHGGVEAALREVNSISDFAPPPPPRVVSAPQPATSSRHNSAFVPSHAPPPPPNPPLSRSTSSALRIAPPVPPPPPQKAIPVPPPPPPAVCTTAPPPPPPPSGALEPPAPPAVPPVKESHSNLMEEIRRGGTLRHISPEKSDRPSLDTRDTLMGQIRQGVTLKKVETSGGTDATEFVGNGIAGMLQRALQERGTVMGLSSSEEESDDGDEEDEWD